VPSHSRIICTEEPASLVSFESQRKIGLAGACYHYFCYIFLSAKHPSLQKRLRPIIRQRNTHQRPRLDSPIRTRVRKTTKHKLVYGEVQIPIFSSGKLYQCQHNTHPPTQGYRLKLTVSIQFNLGSLTNVLTVPFAGLKIDTAFCSIFPW
jgi:hypothetical protein